MIQELFRIGPISISPFGVLLALAFSAAYFQLRWGLRQAAAGGEEDASAMVLAAGLGGIVGAKVYYAILYKDWHLLFDRFGLVWYGGFILGTLAVLWTMRRRRLPLWPTADAATPALALGYAIGRLGCFLVGDDYGRPTDLPWGVRFANGLPPTDAGSLRSEFGLEIPADIPDDRVLAVHPTQIYETLLALVIWGIALWLVRRGARPGTVTLVTVALLAAERFGVEFLRAKDDRFLGPFTLAQMWSVVALVAVLWLWAARPRRARSA